MIRQDRERGNGSAKEEEYRCEIADGKYCVVIGMKDLSPEFQGGHQGPTGPILEGKSRRSRYRQ